jgi:NAD(P)-dependent dehydrogenase (short-subunit alcohol dehydrogenase family)
MQRMASPEQGPAVVIAGIGEGFGLALARTFAGAGYDIIGVSRSGRCDPAAAALTAAHGRAYLPLTCDLADDDAVARILAPHAARIEVAIYNAHHLVIAPFLETAARDVALAMMINCGGAVAMVRALLPAMLARGQGTLIMTGATAARRASAGFAALAMSKFALRALAQSLAREYAPKGIHVAHVVVDGLIDEPQTHRRFPDRSGVMIDGDALAATYLSIVRQPPSTWTQEIDVRPSSGKF